ncbi:MBL fold metallo-hydrolase [Teichococcus wenyumeiae]|uniref:MBL fold metallo-hydrolase n=1 Tax=Teichococcus wenyumeiae TaxID=2478470 RepID=UPI00131479EE|nr:MBL fold metallo-hydrolase [Pseudoroseomonas wenyumeiae]
MSLARPQVPGFHPILVGDTLVTCISDGSLPAGIAALNNIGQEEARHLLDAAFAPPVPRTQVSTYLIQAGGRFALVDTGGGRQHMAPSVGFLADNLARAGVEPGQIDTVLLTHSHPDHSYGLVTSSGEALFPNAEVLLHAEEACFWLSPGAETRLPPQAQRYLVPTLASFAPYQGRIRTFTGGEVFPTVTAVPLPGHTPGHSGYRIASGADSLLIWGDVAHVPDIQLLRPEVGIAFDIDTAQAAETRRRVLEEVAVERQHIAGMHLHFPGFGHVERRGGGYGFVPSPWSDLPG